MMTNLYPYILGVLAAVGVIAFIVELLRRGILKEKFAFLWLAVSIAVLIMAIFPSLIGYLASWLGVQVPTNLLFFLTACLLLLVSIQLSYEISRVEGRTRRLAEEVAILRERVEMLDHNAKPDEPRENRAG